MAEREREPASRSETEQMISNLCRTRKHDGVKVIITAIAIIATAFILWVMVR